MRNVVVFFIGAVVGCTVTIAAISVAGGWYTYQMLPAGSCTAFRQGHYDASPGWIMPAQPNDCYIQTPRFHLP